MSFSVTRRGLSRVTALCTVAVLLAGIAATAIVTAAPASADPPAGVQSYYGPGDPRNYSAAWYAADRAALEAIAGGQSLVLGLPGRPIGNSTFRIKPGPLAGWDRHDGDVRVRQRSVARAAC
jgi:hypothetical protein